MIAIVIAAASLAAGCGKVEGKEEPAPRPVKVMETRTAASANGLRYAVTIQPHTEVSMAFKTSGYVAGISQRRGTDGRLHVLQPGDPIEVGAVLAYVQDQEYRERVAQAESSLREADASRVKASHDFERAQYLYSANSLKKPEFDAAMAAYDAASARMASLGAQATLAEISLRDTALVSPLNGVVFERRVEVGSLVGGGTIGFVVGNISSVKAVFGVPDSLVDRVTPGSRLDVTTEALGPDVFAGTVTSVSPSADAQSHIFDVELTIPNADGRLKPGMIGAVAFHPDAVADEPALPAVPLTSIVRSTAGSSGYAVFVVEQRDGKEYARTRPVTLGAVKGNTMTVTSGLNVGERVIVMGAGVVGDHEHVRVIP
jgi:RND family efflux transporter MFP subunit